ncbi:GNAT family N-acetyltransferase [Motilibacter aurantiacus]|uniref:GNAT family N-acetyltransferase n=1 Tax=Motilibacter aurantiacus TaxID=2714955 RepID=UPI00140A1758|nr:GNAT family N-acetyltransferase [Motilibacter aurantiacus]NHC44938.1 GNAT family N-acetyltransferase [Motilibacter aurantiacus]
MSTTRGPGARVLAARLTRLLATDRALALIAGDPPAGLALVACRPDVWHDRPVALLDELHVAPQGAARKSGRRSCAPSGRTTEHGRELVETNVDGDDVAARHSYERHGYVNHEPGRNEQLLFYYRELGA